NTASTPSPPYATSSPDGHGCCPQPAQTPKQLPWFAHRVSLVELVGEHAHHDEVVVPAGEENVFPQLL
ncbi:hypothetical protein, partial [Streptomyces sp. NPDC002758]